MSQNISPTKNSIPSSLFEILEQETELSKIILDTIVSERTAISKMDLPALVSLSKKKEKQLLRLQTLDESLHQTISRMAGAPKDAVSDNSGKWAVNLNALIPLACAEEAEQLKQHRSSLKKMREEIKAQNHINKRFAQDVQTCLNDAISLITRSISDEEPYRARGASKSRGTRPVLISREV